MMQTEQILIRLLQVSQILKKSHNPHPAVTLPTGQILFVHLLLKFKELLTVLEEPLLPAFVHQK